VMHDTDFKPSRLGLVVDSINTFCKEFFEQNPLSQMGLITCRNGLSERLSDLSPRLHLHQSKLSTLASVAGPFSAENLLRSASILLERTPVHASREVLMFVGAISSVDPGNLSDMIDKVISQRIKVSVISLSAEVWALKDMCQRTGGSFMVVPNAQALVKQCDTFAQPPPMQVTARGGGGGGQGSAKHDAALIAMGFPTSHLAIQGDFCACHQTKPLAASVFVCPRCAARLCDVPGDCPSCGLTLVLAPHLSRSYHHLFPVPTFTRATDSMTSGTSAAAASEAVCGGCSLPFEEGDEKRWRCPKCSQVYCACCQQQVHESLYNCPQCLLR